MPPSSSPIPRTPYAEVAVNSPIARGTHTFHYAIPSDQPVAPGQLVLVPFGDHHMQGVVLDLVEEPEVAGVKAIARVIEPRPVLTGAQIGLARWIADYYQAPLFDAIRLMLPPGLSQHNVTRFALAADLAPAALPNLGATRGNLGSAHAAAAVVELLRSRGPLRIEQIRATLKLPGLANVVNQLVRKKVLRREIGLAKPRLAARMVRYVALAPAAAEAAVKARLQVAVLSLLRDRGPMPRSAVVKETACSASTIATLINRGLLLAGEREERRDPLARVRAAAQQAPDLTAEQERVWQEILAGRSPACGSVFLLHGVTGSGKTELYLRAIELTLREGKQAIVLVPEIALTPQTVHRFAARFPGAVAVLHSKLSAGERYDEWRRIRDGEAPIVIGSRSAVFAPLPQPGLVVIDEEHEWSYKQDKAPRYHAREVALKLAELSGAGVLLGSATPDVESRYRAESGRYRVLELAERVSLSSSPAAAPRLPPVHVVDMRDELKAGNRGIFSRSLREAIDRALNAGEQIILFLNRRGTASFVICRDCGLVMRCRRCDVSLVFHSAADRLVCHQCNYRRPVPASCPACSSGRIKFFGLGTEKVEQETRREFPRARVMRWDRDVTATKLAHEELMRRFAGYEADILVGTQMIAKGLDVPRVTVVGVISADVALHLPDFRSGERTFQLLTQVAGRAGRGERPGLAIVQTYSPHHYAVQAASRHDYDSFYQKERAFRQEHGYPPFGRLARLVYSHSGQAQAERAADAMAGLLRAKIAQQGIPGTVIYGPAPAYHRLLRGKHRWHLMIRGSHVTEVLRGVSLPLGWAVDIDPMSLL